MSAKKQRGWWVYALILLFSLGLTEGAAHFLRTEEDGMGMLMGQRLLPFPILLDRQVAAAKNPDRMGNYFQADDHLGWTIAANGQSEDGMYFANALGLRSAAARPVPDPERADRSRVLLIGDSYTHGDEVPYAETWGAQLQTELGSPWEVWNGGVSGYGTDQAFLRWRRLLPKVRPRVAILGIYREDLLRNCTIARPIKHRWTGLPFGKPRFVLEGESLRLVHQPVTPPSEMAALIEGFAENPMAEHDALYNPAIYRSSPWDRSLLARWFRSRQVLADEHDRRQALQTGTGEAVLVTARIALRFTIEARDAGIHPIVMLIPGGEELASHGPGRNPSSRHILTELERLGIETLDAGPILHAAIGVGGNPARFYKRDGAGHPNAEAGAHIATWLAPYVKGR